jgi:hypothetical protein
MPLAYCALLASALQAQTPVDQANIDAVKAGTVKVARASWWGFDPADSTEALQAAFNSGAEKVIVEDLGSPWIVETLRLASDQEVVFEEGAIVEAKRGSFKGTGDSLFTAWMTENVTLRGYGATWRMHKADYQGPDYAKAEWRHTLQLRGARNTTILGLALEESGGDGIYVGVGDGGAPCVDVTIRDVVCDRHHRQGISVISVRNLLIENTIMRATSGTPPMAGIDFEPNGPTEELVNCVMRNCTSEGNQGDGYDFYIPTLNATSTEASIRFENCRSIGNSRGLVFTTGNGADTAVQGRAEFAGCTFEGSRGPGIILNNKPAEGFPMRFEGCAVVNCAVEQPTQSPIMFGAEPAASRPVGGVQFIDCSLTDPVDRRPMSMNDFSGGLPVVGVSGRLTLDRNGQRDVLELTDGLLDEWMPTRKLKPIPPYDLAGRRLAPVADSWQLEGLAGALRLRNAARLALYAAQGDAVSFRVRYAQVGQYSGQPLPVKVTAPSGAVVLVATGEFMQETPFEFTAAETGSYEVTLDPGANTAQVVETTHPFCVISGGDPLHFLGTTGDVFFYVPAEVTEFALKVFGEGSGEGVRATLFNAQDEQVEDRDDITQPHQFYVQRPAAADGEVWRLHLQKATTAFLEDFQVQLQGVPSVLAPSRDAMLAPE